MDNDGKIKKFFSNIYKDIRFKISYRNENILSKYEGNDLIRQLILSGEPCMIARFGAAESRCIEKWMNNKDFNQDNLENIKQLSGVFPNDSNSIAEFCEVYTEAISDIDVLAVWGVAAERNIYKKHCPSAKLMNIMSLEPFFYKNPWSAALRGKKLLIVNLFTETIKKQLINKDKLFEDAEVLPDFKEVSYFKTVQSYGGSDEYESWLEALKSMCSEIKKIDFDVAIIGAGAYGLPLASYVKSLGKQSIQMAGATQLLFGIKGKRWEERTEYKKLFNEYWVHPSSIETPKEKDKVEGGSYW
ncbi:MAG: hypothetical protein E6248_04045 [Clostridium sp.]|uniref:hypothetical protein n=1 Tax=Clostridium sp. TaxID=1506 RepID=UPI002910C43D|nr:hypothetical protein [Clostridium sp.]MDU5109593.1 hypothetical protein [Clostridium sp.]